MCDIGLQIYCVNEQFCGGGEAAHCKELGLTATSCAKTAEPVMLFGCALGWAQGTAY